VVSESKPGKEIMKEYTRTPSKKGEFCLLGYNPMQSVESQSTFRGTYRLDVQGPRKAKKETRMKQIASRLCYTSLYLRKQKSYSQEASWGSSASYEV
jgi:hypothetical protein